MSKTEKSNIEFRLKAIQSAEKIGIKKSSELYAISRNTLANWIKNYKNNGVEGLYNRSRDGQKHSAKVPIEIVKKILDYSESHKNTTLEEIKKELKLSCSIMTISRIKNRNMKKTKPEKNNSILFSIQKIYNSNSLYKYLYICVHLKSNLVLTSVSNYNSHQSLGVFADYVLSNVKISNAIIYCSKNNITCQKIGNFNLFEYIVIKKYKLTFVQSLEDLENKKLKTLEFLIQSFNDQKTNQLSELYLAQTEFNLKSVTKGLKKQIWIQPLLIDKYLSDVQIIKNEIDYWTKQASAIRSVSKNIIKRIIDEKRFEDKNNSSITLQELYEIANQSELNDYKTNMYLYLKISENLIKLGHYDKAIIQLQLTSRIASLNKDDNYYLKSIYILSEIYFERGEYKNSLTCLNKILLKIKFSTKTDPNFFILPSKYLLFIKCAACLNNIGFFSKSLYYYSKAERICTDPAVIFQIAIGKINVIYSKGEIKKSIILLNNLLELFPEKISEIYDKLIEYYFQYGEYKSAEYYGNLRCNMIDQKLDKSLYNFNKSKIGFIKYAADRNRIPCEYFEGVFEECNEIIKSDKFSNTDKIHACHKLAIVHIMTGFIDKSIELHRKALLISLNINNSDQIANCYLVLTIDYDELKDYKQALKYCKKRLNILNKIGKFRQIIECKILLAGLHFNLCEYDKSIKILYDLNRYAVSNDDILVKYKVLLGMIDINLMRKNATQVLKILFDYELFIKKYKHKRFEYFYLYSLCRYYMLIDEPLKINFVFIKNLFKKVIKAVRHINVKKDIEEVENSYNIFLKSYKAPL
ncbi:MAG: tetratricopeptide repeat protein [Candidatus Delongbacteria bacterium]|nr:tetratricopeptide repeat protein [Candidatus Delongbacteria bacterium]